MALFPTPLESCYFLAPELTDTGLWRDLSPFGLHVQPVGYAGPALGLFTGPSGAKAISFDGATQFGELPLRFYDHAPTSAITVAVVARHAAPVVAGRIFSAADAGITRGITVQYTTVERLYLFCCDATAAVTCVSLATDDAPLTSRTRVTVLSATLNQGLRWVDRVGRAASASANANPIAYDATALPIVGADVTAANFAAMDLYHLSIYDRVWSHAEAVAFSDYWRDRT